MQTDSERSMKKAALPEQMHDVVNSIGDFIEYWGFKNIHGRIWALIFLADRPVDANYLINKLNVSKALVSMSLKDLIQYNVIQEIETKEPTTHYTSNDDIYSVIVDVLLKREAKMLSKIKSQIELLQLVKKDQIDHLATQPRIKDLHKMTKVADSLLKSIFTLRNFDLNRFKSSLQLRRR